MHHNNEVKTTIISLDLDRVVEAYRQRFTVPDHMGKSQNQTHTHNGDWYG